MNSKGDDKEIKAVIIVFQEASLRRKNEKESDKKKYRLEREYYIFYISVCEALICM